MVKVKNAIQKIKTRMKEEFKHVSWILLSVSLIVYGLRENVNLFIGVTKLKSHEQEYEGKHLRLGAIVKEGSVMQKKGSIEFEARDIDSEEQSSFIKVIFNGVPPSLFKEGKAMVADGTLKKGIFYAEEVLAKHDESYQIPMGKKDVRQ